MSFHRSKIAQSMKEYKDNSNIKMKLDNIDNKKIEKNEEKIKDIRPKMKVDYKNSNYFYNEEDYYKEYPYKRIEYYSNENKGKYGKYNIESNSSHITVENEDGIIKYIPNKGNYNYNYNNYNEISSQKNNKYVEISNNKNNDYYDDNSDFSDNNEYYENEEYENGIINNNSPRIKYNQLQENIDYYLAPKKQKKKKNQNIISKDINNEINYSSDKNLKIRPLKKNIHKCGSNTTTTNNTYNNNIYYINPINVKNKNKMKEKSNIINNNNRKNNNSRKNFIYKSVDITLQKKRNKERDYFKINNIDKSKRKIYIKAAILIQSIFRGYLVKIKLYNNVNLYVCCKRGIDILEELILKMKNEYWKIFKNNINNINNINNNNNNNLDNKSTSFSIRARYKLKNNKSKEPRNSFYKETGDSFIIVNENIKRDNNEKKLKYKLYNVIKENNILKKQLIESKNIELKLKLLIDENKKNQNINSIIMKDNMQLAKKLKDIQDYRNHRLFIENQYSIDLNQIDKIQIQELNKNYELFLNKLKILMLEKLLYKKINKENNIIKEKIYKYRNIVQKLKENDKENNYKKEISFNNIIKIIEKNNKLLLNKYFWNLYYNGLTLERENEIKENNINEILKKIIYKKEQKNKIILNKMFFKFVINNLKCKNEEIKNNIEKQEEEEKEILKLEKLKKIFIKYENNARFIYKVILEKWNLKSKIIGMKTAARDKKKKRKQKKKNNRLLFNKNFGFGENNSKKMFAPLCKSIHEFSYIVSNGNAIKESNSNEFGRVLLGNKSTSNLNNKNNNSNLNEKELKKKKNKSVNKKSIFKDKKDIRYENKDNINNNDNSEDDSGDSFGLDNNSD